MNLLPAAEAMLRLWYGPSTWHTHHVLDMNRWYDFVNQYQRDQGFSIDETGLREHIEQKIQVVGHPMNDDLSKVISERISLMHEILDFLKQTGR